VDDKHDPNGSVPIGTFTATSDDGTLEIPIEIVEDGYEERELAIAEPIDPIEPPRRQRTATLLGVPMPGGAASRAFGLSSESDPTKASRREISAAVDDALDERPTTIYGYKRDSFADLEEVIEGRDADRTAERRGEVIGVIGSESDTGTYRIEVHEVPEARKSPLPVLAPAEFVQARARDAKDTNAKASNDPIAMPTAADKPREPITKVVSADRAREIAASTVAARAERSAPATSASTAAKSVEPPPPVNKPVSSLAPTEVKRATQVKREPASAIGYALLAAVVLLGLGGWFVTRGTYQRAIDPAAPPAPATAVARPSDSLGSGKLDSAPVLQTAQTAPSSAEPSTASSSVASNDAASAGRTTAQPSSPSEAVGPSPKPRVNAVPALPGASKPRVASKGVKKKAVAAAAPAGPIETPSRDDVLTGLDRVRSNVRACAEGRQGVAEVDLTIAKNGVVTNALVGGDFGGTPQGSCIARAVRKAKFPQFTQDRYRVLFPYVL
jgi:hypothetical protein